MKIGLVVFAYNRDEHLKKVLEALRKNEKVDSLYIFQDGLKCEEHRNGWENTRKVIEDYEWCSPIRIYSKYNKGLANSIVDGINKVFEDNDAIIVLEDDCVPTACFISFMKQCFERYRYDGQVYTISGYSWPIRVEKQENDIYFCGRSCSYGWGTWKDRWDKYKRDYDVLGRLKTTEEGSKNLAMWGMDLELMLVQTLRRQNDSWSVFWSLKIIEEQGYNIVPYNNLITNIGFDGSGVHCGYQPDSVKKERVEIENLIVSFPARIEFEEHIIKGYAELYGSYAVLDDKSETKKEKVLVWGIGYFYKNKEKELVQKYDILAYVDSYQKGYFAGKKILRPKEIGNQEFDKIILMVKNRNTQEVMVEQLQNEFNILKEKIVIGTEIFR